ncbi:MAG: threonine synthase, partial [Oxalobacteraceae bacterium]
MHYVSTRATSASAARNPENFCDILLGGLAPDGGLYLPAEYPQVTSAELDAWRTLSYADLAFEILRKFATDIPDADLKAITTRTYTPAVYCNARAGESAAEITPLRVLEDGRNGKLILQALSNGPTLAFKDMAMQ